ncbi:hypothetical protein [Methyloversatilis universalis]|uniref:hypothetical protein n=1 Tax=Methyloversatilis universalis TaxID=378211 RepID=UPI0011123CBF|nr:hypothetical protein [Methyloversatilis universalis]
MDGLNENGMVKHKMMCARVSSCTKGSVSINGETGHWSPSYIQNIAFDFLLKKETVKLDIWFSLPDPAFSFGSEHFLLHACTRLYRVHLRQTHRPFSRAHRLKRPVSTPLAHHHPLFPVTGRKA